MKPLYVLSLLALLASACGFSTMASPIQLRTEETTPVSLELLPSSTPMVIRTNTLKLTSTAITSPSATTIRQPTSTPTPYPIPSGVMNFEELQRRIDNWISGKIAFTDNDRILDEKNGIVVGLGLYYRDPPNVVPNVAIFVFYNLGFTILQDRQGDPYLVNIVGFEDGKGQRFTFPFHNGELMSQYAIINLLEFRGRRINHEDIISSDQLTPFEFVQKSPDLIGHVNIGITYLDSIGRTEDEGVNEANDYLISAKEIMSELANFLECKDCLLKDIPANLKRYINTIPTEFEMTLPYLRNYSVDYW